MKTFVLLLLLALSTLHGSAASFLDRLQGAAGNRATTNASGTNSVLNLSQDQMVSGLKEALAKGLSQAVSGLGKSSGFLSNLNVRIPVPASLQKVEKTARSLKQDKLVDDFILTMNTAAEKAVPEAAAVFSDAVKQMTIADAKAILTGTNNAATQYFRRTTETNLHTRFLPIVKQATDAAGVSAAYKKLLGTSGLSGDTGKLLGGFGVQSFNPQSLDVDQYVTGKALDGLFLMVAEEEKKIRENPAARTTELLQKVFGALKK
jgi:hypothetical protein